MLIYLLRHGIAQNRTDPKCPPDPERPLTAKGVKRTRSVARGLRNLGVRPTVILTSPYLRAVQTAEIVAKELGVSRRRVRKTKALEPEAEAGSALEEIAKLKAKSVLAAGHAPNLDWILAATLGAEGSSLSSLKKAGVACVELTAASSPSGRLIWLLEPRVLRALGKMKKAVMKAPGTRRRR